MDDRIMVWIFVAFVWGFSLGALAMSAFVLYDGRRRESQRQRVQRMQREGDETAFRR